MSVLIPWFLYEFLDLSTYIYVICRYYSTTRRVIVWYIYEIYITLLVLFLILYLLLFWYINFYLINVDISKKIFYLFIIFFCFIFIYFYIDPIVKGYKFRFIFIFISNIVFYEKTFDYFSIPIPGIFRDRKYIFLQLFVRVFIRFYVPAIIIFRIFTSVVFYLLKHILCIDHYIFSLISA